MQKLRLVLSALVLTFLLPASGFAQSVSDLENLSPEDRRIYMESMSQDERAAMREKWRAERAAMSDEERAAMKQERREKWEAMSEEERDAMRAKRQEGKAKRREKWESMSEEERAAARERMPKHKYGSRGENRPAKEGAAIAPE